MAFIKRRKNKYGEYFYWYKNIRKDGKIVTLYLKKASPEEVELFYKK